MTPLFLASSSPILSAKNVDSLLSTKAKSLATYQTEWFIFRWS